MVKSEITVRKARLDDLHKLTYNDYSFLVDSIAVGPFTNPELTEFQSVQPYTKRYDLEIPSITEYLDKNELALFLAVDSSDTPVGHLAISRFWNGYASVDDMATDVNVRRLGCASKMMEAAVDWAREAGLPGLRVETQHNNAPACRFYQKFGFKLGGYDAHLYDALSSGPAAREMALFWYLHLAG
ncbi:MAG TPA: GNAT family N-acetyltransferase [Oxalicibacterium sp.]|uniref:GNAT family N-acetyltransferase n=1 Tax=Oxalicibacterium sp. TaxID=2766525 RepID=UPI002B9E87DE|nr:GNAT family N-acetyltransferase [Oxalicibacterium sp.]HWU98267.1 GNAT family N-acetyltransferase [Oxalicibacterium sp.]